MQKRFPYTSPVGQFLHSDYKDDLFGKASDGGEHNIRDLHQKSPVSQ